MLHLTPSTTPFRTPTGITAGLRGMVTAATERASLEATAFAEFQLIEAKARDDFLLRKVDARLNEATNKQDEQSRKMLAEVSALPLRQPTFGINMRNEINTAKLEPPAMNLASVSQAIKAASETGAPSVASTWPDTGPGDGYTAENEEERWAEEVMMSADWINSLDEALQGVENVH